MSLKQRIIKEIGSQGPMPFERFMEIALYEPDGFFGGQTLRSQKSGDFLTSPEVSRLFGETLADTWSGFGMRSVSRFNWLRWQRAPVRLLRPLLDTLEVDALAVETSPAARRALEGLAEISELPETVRGVVIANELLDNLPMALAQRVDGAWRERWVGVEGEG
jgi:SAM-dependent MidA family methyltransferase